jgi:hypothetical protein
MPVDSALRKWSDMILEAGVVTGRLCNSAMFYKSQLEAVGFTNVVEIVHKWPGNRWPRDKHYKELGSSATKRDIVATLIFSRHVES